MFQAGLTPSPVNHQGPFLPTPISLQPRAEPCVPQRGRRPWSSRPKADIAYAGRRPRLNFPGTARASQQSMGDEPLLIPAALVVIYIVLGILYESTIHPADHPLDPALGRGGRPARADDVRHGVHHHRPDRRDPADRHRQEERHHDDRLRAAGGARQGLTPREAILEACLLRFRPILMTDPGGAARRAAAGHRLRPTDRSCAVPSASSIVGGLIVSQVLTLYTTPVIYLYLDRLQPLAAPPVEPVSILAQRNCRSQREEPITSIRDTAWTADGAGADPARGWLPRGSAWPEGDAGPGGLYASARTTCASAAIVPAQYKESMKGLEARRAARRLRQGSVVDGVPRPRASTP